MIDYNSSYKKFCDAVSEQQEYARKALARNRLMAKIALGLSLVSLLLNVIRVIL